MEYYSAIKNDIAICRKMDGTEDHHVEQDKPSSERCCHVFVQSKKYYDMIVKGGLLGGGNH
jgi:hypothetical protein